MYRPEEIMRGMKRLMLRLPALRPRLQELAFEDGDARLLCGAFEDAATALEALRKGRASPRIIQEYEEMCAEIERDIARLCNDF